MSNDFARFSQTYIPTLKENPADAEVVSQKLLLRAGYARRMASGLYVYLPLGLRVIEKIARIVREEMNAAGFQELLLPMVQPGDLWRETGRWDHYGKELLRFKDRNGRDYCLGPTHEEVITDLVRKEVKSYRQLPVRLYQIQTKFRDEIRPRFGLMRGREFLMKDGYSFDVSIEAAEKSYKLMYDAYMRIFSRLGLNFRPVEADTGSIGGNFSHEFMVLADTGEDTIAVCDNCEYAANVERADVVLNEQPCTDYCPPMQKVATPGQHTVEEVAKYLNVSPKKIVKTLLFLADNQLVAALVRGDREINEIKLKKMLNAETIALAPAPTVQALTQAPLGFAGPVGLEIPVYADKELLAATAYITGANEADMHLENVDLGRDVKITAWGDLRFITEEDPCPACGGKISLTRGIEAGHIFMLGQKYSEAMEAIFLDENGTEKCMVMGCYGIGVSRLAAAAIEQGNDDKGIIFPPQIAPYHCIVLNLDPKNEQVTSTAESLCKSIAAMGYEVLLDDRQERPGVKFNDADLIGLPMRVVVGARGLVSGHVECQDRRTGKKCGIPLTDFAAGFENWANQIMESWNTER